ncbi:secretin receptor [Harpegnathos saltator]|uniref:Secretin receptor n=1 Tax=Harpegnathos saltator TaxID=610380 RepID=E2BLA1_HARSA|nr:secretin receptor [Harpegnathos saltator]EFN83538.1 Secretin receptor [Harpegnathos saltator]
MAVAEIKRFLDEQQHKCDRLLNEIFKISSSGDFDNSTDRYHLLKKYHGLAGTNAIINETDNRIEIPPCPSILNLFCWSLSNIRGTTVLSCPLAWIIRSDDLTSNSLKNLTMSSRICLANNQWYQNLSGTSSSLCAASDTSYMSNYTHKYPLDLAIGLSRWLRIIKIISFVGYTTSLITLIAAMVIFSLLRKLWNPRNRLHMHLFASFIMRAFMALLKYLIFIDGIGFSKNFVFIDEINVSIKETWVCKVFMSLWQYFIMANYSWILMEGLYLHNLILLALCSKTSTITLYILLGWGLPGLIVVPWIIIRATMEDTFCWTINDNSLSFLIIIRIPIMISILFNFMLFLNIVRVLFVKLKTSVHLQQKKMQYKRWAKSTLVLIPLFGAHYAIFIELSYHENQHIELVWLFFDQLSASFQGTFVALLYCLLNGEVRAELHRIWNIRRSKRSIDSFNSGHRELSKNPRNKINRKRHRSEGDNVSYPASISMRELSLP